eukprot:259989-Pyramimonas_sp.AAC.1
MECGSRRIWCSRVRLLRRLCSACTAGWHNVLNTELSLDPSLNFMALPNCTSYSGKDGMLS